MRKDIKRSTVAVRTSFCAENYHTRRPPTLSAFAVKTITWYPNRIIYTKIHWPSEYTKELLLRNEDVITPLLISNILIDNFEKIKRNRKLRQNKTVTIIDNFTPIEKSNKVSKV